MKLQGLIFLTDKNIYTYKTLFDENDIRRAIARISHEIIESNEGTKNLILLGIQTRGQHIAKRISEAISTYENISLNYYSIDPKFFRDDIKTSNKLDSLNLEISVQDKNLVLIDDVLFTGRTIRASLEAIFSLGRPNNIKLAALIDRGHREVPIRPDFVGKNIPTSNNEHVKVSMKEIDGVDKIELYKEEIKNK